MPLTYPNIDPVALHVGPLMVRWYSLAYIGGILLGWWYARWLNRRQTVPNLDEKALDDIMLWVVLGIVGGGRLGYVLFYKPDYYLEYPFEILRLWEGGMSFHGGLIGVILAIWWFCRTRKIPYLMMMDIVSAVVPIGLLLGRLANFINGELYGRTTDAWIGMVFPRGGELPRHPSQLYEASLEGLLLGLILFYLVRFTNARNRPGLICGVFLAGYGTARATVEHFREPDAFLGYLFGFITMGQLLCVPMLLLGSYLIVKALRREPASAA